MFFKTKPPQNPPYTLKRYKRSKTLKIIIKQGGEVVVTAPHRVSLRSIEQFVHERKKWIEEKVEYFSSLPETHIKTKPEDYKKHKEEARELVHKLLSEVNSYYKFPYNRVAIRDQKTRWGSCSRQRNLNFSYKLVFLPEKLAKYVVIHEICHLKEFNHGPSFWKLVEEGMPDYKTAVLELHDFKI